MPLPLPDNSKLSFDWVADIVLSVIVTPDDDNVDANYYESNYWW